MGAFFKQEYKNYTRSPLFDNNTLIPKSEFFVFNNPALCRRRHISGENIQIFHNTRYFIWVQNWVYQSIERAYIENNTLRITQEFESMTYKTA
jgi:hypothetical protein